jgi:hypothetical protein
MLFKHSHNVLNHIFVYIIYIINFFSRRKPGVIVRGESLSGIQRGERFIGYSRYGGASRQRVEISVSFLGVNDWEGVQDLEK